MSNSNTQQVNLIGIIAWILRSIKKNFKWLFIINSIICVSIFLYKISEKKVWSGVVTIKSNIVEFNHIESILEPLQQHVEEGKQKPISNSLNVSDSLGGTFAGFQLNSIIDEEYQTKRKFAARENMTEYELDQIFTLEVRSTETKHLSVLKDAIINYLRNQKYIKERQAFFLGAQTVVAQSLKKDMESMREIKENLADMDFKENLSNNNIFIEGLGDLYFSGTGIYKKYTEANYSVAFSDSFEEVSDFEIFEKHAYPRWTPFILAALGSCVVFSFIFILAMDVKERLN